MSGHELIEELVQAMGLPRESSRARIKSLIESHGKSLDALTVEDLRLILGEFMQDVLLDLKQELSAF